MKKTLVLGMSLLMLAVAGAQAAPAKKKSAKSSKSSSRQVKKTSLPAAAPASKEAGFIGGSNLYGRTGLFYTETAQTIREKNASGTAHLTLGNGDGYDVLSLPIGFNYGATRNLEVAASVEYLSIEPDGGEKASGLGYFSVEGKYVFPATRSDMPDFAVLGEISHGPIAKKLGDDGNDFTFKGLATYYLADGLMLNGGAGLLFVDGRNGQDSDTVFQLEAGGGYPITPKLSGIAELAINRFGDDAGMFSLGLRGKATPDLRWQALVGFGVGNDSPDLTFGGGVRYSFGQL